jgi:isoaspartyl peptidase/L-asparaginase-like protein (Ntn-hydrolase superfamily)
MLTRHIKNPIVLARKIMENTPHVMLIGEGAERFAKQHNLIFVDNGTRIVHFLCVCGSDVIQNN